MTEFKQGAWTPKQVKIMGIFTVLVAMITYLVICVGMLQGYPSAWKSLNYSQIQNCNQSTWDAFAGSGFAFSQQWMHPLGNIGPILYASCAKYTGIAKSVNNPLNVP